MRPRCARAANKSALASSSVPLPRGGPAVGDEKGRRGGSGFGRRRGRFARQRGRFARRRRVDSHAGGGWIRTPEA
eukprot:170137-Prorocentrum_minimum.AAC.2